MASSASYTVDPSSARGFYPSIPQEQPSKSLVDIINSRWGDGWATVRVLRHQKPEHRKVLIADATRATFAVTKDVEVFSRLVELPPLAQLDIYIRRDWKRKNSTEFAELQVLDIRRPTARCDEIVLSPRVLVYCKDRVFLPYTPDSDDNIINMKFLTKWLIIYETKTRCSPEIRRQRGLIAKYFEDITSDIKSWPTKLLKWYSRLEWDSPRASPNQCRPLDRELARLFDRQYRRENRPREIGRLIRRMQNELDARKAPVILNKYTLFGGEANDRARDGNIETLREAAVRELREETSRASGVSFELQDFEYNVVDTRGELTIKTPVFFVELSEHDFGRLEVREGREHCNHRVAISEVISDLASGESSKFSTLCHMGGSREEWKKLFEMVLARSED